MLCRKDYDWNGKAISLASVSRIQVRVMQKSQQRRSETKNASEEE